jgi:hypothetical protein
MVAAMHNNSADYCWLQQFPGAMANSGFFRGWNASEETSVYAVAARSTQDVQATVRFATAHNLRLVVDEYSGRSASPDSLLLWTHNMRAIPLRTRRHNHLSFALVPACAGLN